MTSWLDAAALTDRLEYEGFDASAAADRASMFAACAEALRESQQTGPKRAWWVPGRVEVLGKHTDYAGGRSLLCATDLGAAFVAGPRTDRVVTIRDLRSDEVDRFTTDVDLQTTTGDWTNYPRTAARRIARNFGPLDGADIVFKSNLPIAAGMSSSSVLIVAFSTIFLALNHLESRETYRSNIPDLESRAGYLGTVENGQTFGSLDGDAGVGTFGGSEDHTAILCSTPGMLRQYAFCPVRHERTVTFPRSHVFVIASSGVVAEKTGAALERFNSVSALASTAARILGEETGTDFPHLFAALEGGTREVLRADLARSTAGAFSGQDFVDRFDQFVIETVEIIPAAADAIAACDLERFGALVTRSQEVGARLLGNQVEQTIWLADRARELGALTASAFGAGFGGSVYAIVARNDVDGFLERWRSDYGDRFPDLIGVSEFAITEPGPAAFEISIQ